MCNRRRVLLTMAGALVATLAPAPVVDLRIQPLDETALREYAGVYRWAPDRYVYLQIWHEFSGFDKPGQLVAFDETGEIRVLYPAARDRFITGPGAALRTPVESTVEFTRGTDGTIASLIRRREGHDPQTAERATIEWRENVHFASGNIRLAGTLIRPAAAGRTPAVILVHGSGPENREFVLPFARFLVRHGVAVLGYDKRGVGESPGNWQLASFADLASDVVGAFEYLRTRSDIDPAQIGLLGISQAGWIMPLAAIRATDLAFLISISGAAVTPAETTIDQAQNEMTARGMKPDTVAAIISIMKLQYEYARTGEGWDEYAAARDKLAARIGQPPETMPGAKDDPHWDTLRRTYFYDPAPVLRRLEVPVLALFGELDDNILAVKNERAWEAALKAGRHPDYTMRILPEANHYLWDASPGTSAEMASLQRFAPEYFAMVREWLGKRVRLREG